jgi:hypothetical protein
MAVQKHQRVQCLVLCGSGYLPLDRQVRQELANLGCSEFGRVPHSVEAHEPDGPPQVSFFRSDAVMPRAYDITQPIKELRFRCR